MNCFNIRELQGILKRKFFTDLVNSSEHKYLLDSSVIGLRFKNNLEDFIRPDQSLFYNYGLTMNPKSKYYTLQNINNLNYQNNNLSFMDNYIMSYFTKSLSTDLARLNLSINSGILQPFNEILSPLKLNYLLRNIFTNTIYYNIEYTFNYLIKVFNIIVGLPKKFIIISSHNLNYTANSSVNNLLPEVLTTNYISNYNTEYLYRTYKTENIVNYSSENSMFFNFIETSNSFRVNRFNNPLVNYDYKCGHYITIWDQLYPSSITPLVEVSRGIRKAPWFYSDQFIDLLKKNYNQFFLKFTSQLNLKLSEADNWYSAHIQPMDNYFNLYYLLKTNEGFINLRWLSLNTLNQKFYKMFNSSSTQQRILTNWRHLKFTREAWRCKLLISRHQNTLYRRFVSEDNLVYAIERNTKDLLPGWAMITPFSARTRFTAVGKTDVGLFGVFLALNASIVSSANFLVTYRYLSTLNNRKMRDARSFFSEGLITAS